MCRVCLTWAASNSKQASSLDGITIAFSPVAVEAPLACVQSIFAGCLNLLPGYSSVCSSPSELVSRWEVEGAERGW